jgi:flagellar basal-body rod protein FlgF
MVFVSIIYRQEGQMVKGLYTSSEGMIPLMAKQDQIANNLANINTVAYKKSKLLVKSFTQFLQNDLKQPFVNDKIAIDQVVIDFQQGPMKQTDNPLDVAIEGEGFFCVETPGGIRYTRDGNCSINRDGELVTAAGYPLLGKTGQGDQRHIKVEGNNINILADGTVSVDGEEAGVLRLVNFSKPYALEKQGDSLYRIATAGVTAFDASGCKLQQGFLEISNAEPVESMVEMIAAFRNYEANEKSIWAQNETLGKAVNEVGRLNQ